MGNAIMLLVFMYLLVVSEQILAESNPPKECNCGFGYELLEHRLEQMERNQQERFHVQNNLTEHIVKSLTKMLEHRLEQMERNQQERFDVQNNLTEHIVKSLIKMVDQTSNALNLLVNHQKRIIESCKDATTSGRYRLQLPNYLAPITVVCETEPFDGGWLVIQRRSSGAVGFNRSWSEYRDGFGDVEQFGEFWLGLETIHQLTKAGDQELLVELKNETGHDGYARYRRFKVAGADQNYRLDPLGEYTGSLEKFFNINNNAAFSTYDRDNDKSTYLNYAQEPGGGWWFN